MALVAKQTGGSNTGGGGGGGKTDGKGEGEKGEAAPSPPAPTRAHPEDEGSLRRWEELLKAVDVNGGRWRSDVLGVGFHGECKKWSFFFFFFGGGGVLRRCCHV